MKTSLLTSTLLICLTASFSALALPPPDEAQRFAMQRASEAKAKLQQAQAAKGRTQQTLMSEHMDMMKEVNGQTGCDETRGRDVRAGAPGVDERTANAPPASHGSNDGGTSVDGKGLRRATTIKPFGTDEIAGGRIRPTACELPPWQRMKYRLKLTERARL